MLQHVCRSMVRKGVCLIALCIFRAEGRRFALSAPLCSCKLRVPSPRPTRAFVPARGSQVYHCNRSGTLKPTRPCLRYGNKGSLQKLWCWEHHQAFICLTLVMPLQLFTWVSGSVWWRAVQCCSNLGPRLTAWAMWSLFVRSAGVEAVLSCVAVVGTTGVPRSCQACCLSP